MRRLSELIETFFNFWRNFGWFPWRKIREATEGRGTVLKLENIVWGEFCENPLRLSICNGYKEAVEYISVDRFCILEQILSRNYKNTLPLHNLIK